MTNLQRLQRDFKTYKATYVIVGLTVLVWLMQLLRSGGQPGVGIALFHAGALFPPAILQDPTQIWRLFTPIFLHLTWTHFIMNAATVFFIGRQIEQIFGPTRYTAIYLLSGIFGNAMTFFLSPETLSAGASTAIFGLFAAIASLGYFTGNIMLKYVGKSFVALIIINLVFNVFQMGTVNIWGHVGGALGGLLLAAIFPPQRMQKQVPLRYRNGSMLLFVVFLLIFIALPFLNR